VPFKTVAEIRAANKALGHHWFSPDTLRFFDSRILDGVIRGRLFVTSESPGTDGGRRYTIRIAQDSGEVDTVGEFMGYATQHEARIYAASVPLVECAQGDYVAWSEDDLRSHAGDAHGTREN
jgi:hypothetical protein